MSTDGLLDEWQYAIVDGSLGRFLDAMPGSIKRLDISGMPSYELGAGRRVAFVDEDGGSFRSETLKSPRFVCPLFEISVPCRPDTPLRCVFARLYAKMDQKATGLSCYFGAPGCDVSIPIRIVSLVSRPGGLVLVCALGMFVVG